MFFKLVGVVIIVSSSYILGIYFSRRSSFRNQDLEQLKKALTIFKGDVMYSSIPLGEVFTEISTRVNGPIAMVFHAAGKDFENRKGESVQEIWDKNVVACSKNSYLNSEDFEYVFSFGRTLGYLDKEQQSNNARLLIEYIEHSQKILRQKRSTEERLYKTLGIMCGLMVSIVLF